ncbi:hypothetical protein RUND412_006251 [Rhizina undulata]
MCLIKVRPETEEEEVVVPARVSERIRRHRSSRDDRSRDSRSRNRSRNRSMSHSHSRSLETTTIVETIQMPPPPVSSIPNPRVHETTVYHANPPGLPTIGTVETAIVKRSDHHWDGAGPRASVVSTQSRDYYVDSSFAGRSPRSSYRYVDPRGSSQRMDGRPVSRGMNKDFDASEAHLRAGRGDRYGYNNFHGRRSGSIHYVNPRHSTASYRSGRSVREKVVVVDDDGRVQHY